MASEPLAGCHALVLAAGAGTRFDGAKLLADFRGEALVRHAVRAMLASRVERVTVVLGARGDEVAAALGDLVSPRLTTVECLDWQEGLSASLRCGIEALPPDCLAVAVALGDMPLIDPGLADTVLGYVLAGAPAVLPEYRGRPAHPVALSPTVFDRLKRLTGDRGARAALKRLPGIVHLETDDPGSARDIDTRADLTRLT
ncbi:MAG: nucleotidyltransferase family protein [Erythrobacter sp.]|nr:nucleotidyltransferase family protein [Erythrobacter sp.]